MRKSLESLGYNEQDINKMTPDEASSAVNHCIKKCTTRPLTNESRTKGGTERRDNWTGIKYIMNGNLAGIRLSGGNKLNQPITGTIHVCMVKMDYWLHWQLVIVHLFEVGFLSQHYNTSNAILSIEGGKQPGGNWVPKQRRIQDFSSERCTGKKRHDWLVW